MSKEGAKRIGMTPGLLREMKKIQAKMVRTPAYYKAVQILRGKVKV